MACYSPLDGMLVHCRGYTLAVNSPVPIYTPDWREALWEWSVLPKNRTQCPKPGLEPRPLGQESSALTKRPLHLPPLKEWFALWRQIYKFSFLFTSVCYRHIFVSSFSFFILNSFRTCCGSDYSSLPFIYLMSTFHIVFQKMKEFHLSKRQPKGLMWTYSKK